MNNKRILYLTDLCYEAKGRHYSEEDIYITDKLKETFDVVLCHPKCAEGFEDMADLIVFRNTGSVIGYKDIYQAFVDRVLQKGLKTYNTFTGKADMRGKQYLLDLTREGYPVIPTGADSIGLAFITKEELSKRRIPDGEYLIQPKIDFVYEVSFYFINDKFEYALYAPDKSKRWELKEYTCNESDIAFANRFIEWNSVKNGIQRVDACRTKDGKLLLVELEDLNPYLSILEVNEEARNRFISDFIDAINNA